MPNITSNSSILLNASTPLFNFIPEKYALITNLAIYIIIIAVYAFFIWKFYKFLAKRDIFHLNLNKYNNSKKPKTKKAFAVIYYILEYFFVLPLLIFFWFGILAILLLFLSNKQSVEQILLVAAAVIGATRLTSYINEDLSREVGKLFPLTMLAIVLLDPSVVSGASLTNRFLEIPLFFKHIVTYIIIIFSIEIVIRGCYELITKIRKTSSIEKK